MQAKLMFITGSFIYMLSTSAFAQAVTDDKKLGQMFAGCGVVMHISLESGQSNLNERGRETVTQMRARFIGLGTMLLGSEQLLLDRVTEETRKEQSAIGTRHPDQIPQYLRQRMTECAELDVAHGAQLSPRFQEFLENMQNKNKK